MRKHICIIAVTLLTLGCQGFLDEKPQKSLVVPSTLSDLQALMDNELLLMNLSPGIPTILSDEYLLKEDILQSIAEPSERNGYVWADDLYESGTNVDWIGMYEQIFYANVVLETLETIERTQSNSVQYDQIKGSAVFYRAHAYFNLLTLFAAMPQDGVELEKYGLIFKESAAIENPPFRLSVSESYAFVEAQLQLAEGLLQEVNSFKTRPSKLAAKSILARFYLFQGEFSKAEDAAEYVLDRYNVLIDYHQIDPSAASTFIRFNNEVIYHSNTIDYLSSFIGEISPRLYDKYEHEDLRKSRFFNVDQSTGRVTFKGSYTGLFTLFSGMTTAELYLILSECKIRNGSIQEGLELLNALRKNRYEASTFTEVSFTDPTESLREVFEERTRELVLRSLSWYDLRRLNHEPDFQRILTKEVGSKTYTLMPNDLYYILPLIDVEIQTYGLEQNP
ncbi:RagB/SusD family nutrient uptake outer membrane protein [Belliella sp. DSM 111904]|uniref:RagB/SusD family nutrient uptake outer membrane protein n=1 Tax=Belliella filtrata TaxID=2923435 RepID=A0ABS9UVP2_9BACT|nr:RagB/SusD family nutrient uptake outer membrane protein [Belliella filtrata]MCH7408139.1 RagB/SusD family nutrient uptake outer membrane protein [Belliella filtrata]